MRPYLAGLFTVLFIVFSGCPLIAQEPDSFDLPVVDYSNPREYIIEDIRVTGVQFIQESVLISLSGLKVGQEVTVPSSEMTRVLEKFWDQGLFRDVKLLIDKTEGRKIWLNIYLKELPRLSRLTVDGLRRGETEDILEKINLRAGSQITDNILNNTRRIIKQHFVEKGFLETEVRFEQSPDTLSPNSVRLKIYVDKNNRVKIDDIIFLGNEVFKDRRLRRAMKNTKKVNLNIFKASRFIKDDYEEDLDKLISFYNENGFRDAKVLKDSVVPVKDKDRISLYIRLEEGDRYYFRNIRWVGNTVYPSEVLDAYLGIERGDVFDKTILDKRLELDEDAVSSLYLDNGYLFFSINPVEVNIENDSIDFEMRINEGKQATINKVVITGNTKTKEHVIRREIRTRPGELFSKSDIIRTVRELAQLGHFDPEQIEPVPIPDQANGTVDLEYKLVEKANDQLEISGGWGANMIVGTIGLRFSNFSAGNMFNLKEWRPIPTGDGQTLSLRAQSNGKYYQAYSVSFIEPWLGGTKPNSLSVSFFHTKSSTGNYWLRNESPTGYFKITGGSVGLGRRLKWPDDFFTLYNELSYQRYDLFNWGGSFLFENGTSNNINFKTTFARKSVDQPIYPRRGSTFQLSLALTPPYSLFDDKDYLQIPADEKYRWIEYHKWTFLGEWYLSLAGNLVLSTRARFGYLGFYNPDIGPSPFEGFDVGGDGLTGYNIYGRDIIALRGYENSALTPIVNGKKSGNVFEKLTVELRYPITLSQSATVFVLGFLEAGNAWYSIDQFNPFLIKRSAGVGLRAFLPMFGLLGIDWGYGFDEIPGKPGVNGSQFHFTIGQQF